MMKIQEIGEIEMFRSNPLHFGNGKIQPVTHRVAGNGAVPAVEGVSRDSHAVSVQRPQEHKGFQDFLLEAVNSVSEQQNSVASITEKLITSPDEVDVHDVTIAMAKARSSLNLAQNVIDRMISSWNEITTTR